MSEEQKESTGTSFKNIILGTVSTITLGVGTWVTTKLTGGEDDKAPAATAAPAPVINITNSNQQSQAAGGKTVIIKEKSVPAAAPADKPKPKKDEHLQEEPKW
jgi:hypothetical protein